MPRILTSPPRGWPQRASLCCVRAAAGAVGLLLVTATLAAGVPAASAQAPIGQTVDPDAHADFQWRVPARYQRSWDAWNETHSHYDASQITPKNWSVTFDACDSRSRRRIERYDFIVQ